MAPKVLALARKTADVLLSIMGLIVLIAPCLLEAWEECDSTEGPYSTHKIDRWKWTWLQAVYGNPEDGVSGRYALIWTTGETKEGANDRALVRVYYRPGMWAPLRAYLWSACRNTADMLKWKWGS